MELFHADLIAEGLYRITNIIKTSMYLAVGQSSALLLDCGAGVGDIAQFVRTLTDKPLTVAITHGHVDHAMGSGSFGPEVEIFLPAEDRGLYRDHSGLAFRQDFVAGALLRQGKPGSVPESAMWYNVRPVEQLRALRPGDSFDIGGEVIEICPGGGHTRGCVTALFREHRILLLGDACGPNTFLFDTESLSVSQYKANLLVLKERTQGRYDRTLLCHGSGDGDMTLIDGAIWLCDAILEGLDDRDPCVAMGKPVFSAKKKEPNMVIATKDLGDHSSANILYSDITRH